MGACPCPERPVSSCRRPQGSRQTNIATATRPTPPPFDVMSLLKHNHAFGAKGDALDVNSPVMLRITWQLWLA